MCSARRPAAVFEGLAWAGGVHKGRPGARSGSGPATRATSPGRALGAGPGSHLPARASREVGQAGVSAGVEAEGPPGDCSGLAAVTQEKGRPSHGPECSGEREVTGKSLPGVWVVR